MAGPSYFLHIDRIKNNPALIEKEERRLDGVISKVSSEIKAAITPQTAPGLIWALAWQEIERVVHTIQNLAETRISDFAGYARYLRALTASVPFRSAEVTDDPKTKYLLERCAVLWELISHREMIETLKHRATDDHKKRLIAASMSLLGAFQLELKYHEQAEARVGKLYEPFSSDIIEPALGLSVDAIVQGFRTVRETVGDRIDVIGDLMRPMYAKWHEFQELASTNISDAQLDAFVNDDPKREQLGDDFAHGLRGANALMVFSAKDLESTLGDRSPRFLAEFSFTPGDVNKEFATPFDHDAVRSRPFARLPNEQFLLMDFYYSAFAPLCRLSEVVRESGQLQRLTKRRDQVLEDDVRTLLSDVVKPQLVLSNYYLPVGKDGVLAERDLLLLRDGTAIIVESKAKPLRPAKHRRDFCKIIESDVKQAIQQGYDQACSVHTHLLSKNGSVVFWDSNKPNRNELASVNRSEISDALVIVVLDAYYGLIAADLAPWLQVNPDVGFPWVVDRDSLESILRVMSSFEQLVSFLHWRRTLHGIVLNEDEAVFAGFFLRHGPADVPKGASIVQLDASYADVFEADYFQRRGLPVEIPTETGPPVWSSMQREGDTITCKIGGEFYDAVDLRTGRNSRKSAKSRTRIHHPDPASSEQQTEHQPHVRPRRNGPCPCGSGRKFKKCCLRHG